MGGVEGNAKSVAITGDNTVFVTAASGAGGATVPASRHAQRMTVSELSTPGRGTAATVRTCRMAAALVGVTRRVLQHYGSRLSKPPRVGGPLSLGSAQ